MQILSRTKSFYEKKNFTVRVFDDDDYDDFRLDAFALDSIQLEEVPEQPENVKTSSSSVRTEFPETWIFDSIDTADWQIVSDNSRFVCQSLCRTTIDQFSSKFSI